MSSLELRKALFEWDMEPCWLECRGGEWVLNDDELAAATGLCVVRGKFYLPGSVVVCRERWLDLTGSFLSVVVPALCVVGFVVGLMGHLVLCGFLICAAVGFVICLGMGGDFRG